MSSRRPLPPWWPLALLVGLAAVIRLSTIDLQSLWYDEAYTPVHVLRPSLWSTLREVVHHENTPPLWYALIWVWTRAFGTGAVALRLPSAIAGTLLVPVGWAIGRELGSRRTATVLAAIIALNPLFVWYSQEGRAYELYALFAGLSLLYFLRARGSPTRANLTLWSASSILALLSQYFAVFLLLPEALLLLAALLPAGPAARRVIRAHAGTLLAVGAVAVCGAALLPLLSAQGGHGTQWIGRWALSSRLVAIPSYYLLGYYGSVLGHSILGLVSLPILAAIVLLGAELAGRRLRTGEYDGVLLMLGIGILSILIPLALALGGADYLAPRNLVADWIPLSAALALVLSVPGAGRAGPALAAVVCLAAAALVLATDLTPRLQRGDWRGVAHLVGHGSGADRAIVTIELGSAPLEYYLPGLSLTSLSPGLSVAVREVDLVGYRPVRPGSTDPPTPAFKLVQSGEAHGLLVYRFRASSPQRLSERFLRERTVTDERSETLVPAAQVASAAG